MIDSKTKSAAAGLCSSIWSKMLWSLRRARGRQSTCTARLSPFFDVRTHLRDDLIVRDVRANLVD
jgi:hypothetical protein